MDECCDDESIFLAIFIFRFLLGFAVDMIVFGLDIFLKDACDNYLKIGVNLNGCGGFHH